MRNTTHELIGVSVALVAARATRSTPLETVGLAGAALYGSWIPDVDQLGARIHRRSRLERRSLAVRFAGSLLRLPMLVFGAVAQHRGTSHSLVACGLMTGLVALLLSPLGSTVPFVGGGGVALGYACHVLADACTPSGVQLFFPVRRRPVRLLPARWRVSTGSHRELVFVVAAVAVLATLVVR